MRALKAAVIAMGVLIAGATAALIVLIALRVTGSFPAKPHPTSVVASREPRRAALPASSTSVLGEPKGSRILAMVPVANGLALALGGGGESDRVVIVDPTSGRIVERVELTH